MKKCAECGREMTVNLLFCTSCGTKVDVPASTRRARILFFLTPFFIILIGVGVGYDLGMPKPADSGIAFGGTFALVYLFSAAVFWILAKFLKFPVLPESYWHAGIFSVFQFIACNLFAYSMDLVFTGEFPDHLGPLQINQNRTEFMLLALLPTWFSGFYLVSVKARAIRFPIAGKNRLISFVQLHGPALQPLFFVLAAAAVFFVQPLSSQYYVMGRLLQDLEVPGRAVQKIDEGISLVGEHPALLYLKGVVILDSMSEEHSAAMAMAALEKAVEKRDNVALYHFRLSMAYDLERFQDKAVESASKAISLLPGDFFLHQHLGDLMLKYKRLPEAVAAFRKSLQLNPDNALLLNNLAYTLLEMNQELPEALELAKKSVEMIPGLVFNLDTLAWAHYKNGQYAEALEIMNAIFYGRTEVSPEVDFHYAMILNAVGALKDPLQAMDKLLAKPEAAADSGLFRQIYEARAEFEAAVKIDLKAGDSANAEK